MSGDTVLVAAASTLREMCDDFLRGGLSDSTFVSNLGMYASQCSKHVAQSDAAQKTKVATEMKKDKK